MSRLVGKITVIEAEPEMLCHECGKIAETRPYGRGGAEICWECSELIPEIRDHNMRIKLFGEPGELRDA